MADQQTALRCVDRSSAGLAERDSNKKSTEVSTHSAAPRVKYRSISSSETASSLSRKQTGLLKEGAGCGAEERVVFLKPILRGKIHLLLLLLTPIWAVLLLRACRSSSSLFAAAAAVFSFCFNFAASALLHCWSWSPNMRNLLSKFDHAGQKCGCRGCSSCFHLLAVGSGVCSGCGVLAFSGIFVVISSSTTPIPVLLLEFWPAVLLLVVQGLATAYGFYQIFFGGLSSGARQRRALTYVLIGCLHALFMNEYISVLTTKETCLIIALAGLYIVGACIYGCRWPDPFPRVFGFHEIFHCCCCCSFLLTLWVDYEVISRVELMKA